MELRNFRVQVHISMKVTTQVDNVVQKAPCLLAFINQVIELSPSHHFIALHGVLCIVLIILLYRGGRYKID